MNADEPTVALHAVLERSAANGPGARAVVWFQGCPLACPGCFNPRTHAAQGGDRVAVADVIERVLSGRDGLEGVTVSGGEPFAQPLALTALLCGIRARSTLSTLVFSGYSLREIERDPPRAASLAWIDVLIAGRYVASQRRARALLGSANQRIHRLSARYGLAELAATPACEVQIDALGNLVATGVDPLVLRVGERP